MTQVPRRPNYALRWVLVSALAVGVVISMVSLLVLGFSSAREEIARQDAAREAAAQVTTYPVPEACSASALGATLSVPETVPAGAGLSVGATVTNTGSVPCLLDAGTGTFTALITSGGSSIWTSATCTGQAQSRPLLIGPGKAVELTVVWDGRVESTTCALPTPTPTPTATPTPGATPGPEEPAPTTQTPQPPGSLNAPGDVAAPGTYRVGVQVGGTDVGTSAVFVIE